MANLTIIVKSLPPLFYSFFSSISGVSLIFYRILIKCCSYKLQHKGELYLKIKKTSKKTKKLKKNMKFREIFNMIPKIEKSAYVVIGDWVYYKRLKVAKHKESRTEFICSSPEELAIEKLIYSRFVEENELEEDWG